MANQETVRAQFYRRDAEVITPVDTHPLFHLRGTQDLLLAGGRIMAYKRSDLIVDALNRLQLPLKIFGSGPMLEVLKGARSPTLISWGA